MRFLVRKRRTAPAVIIVALIDVLIVLVIFLLVTTTFKQQPALKLTLPESTQSLKAGPADNPPLLISINAKGTFYLGTEPMAVTLTTLSNAIVEHKKLPDAKFAVRADTNAPWGQIFKVMDLAGKLQIKLSASAKSVGKP